MSKIVSTKLGRFRAVEADGGKKWLWECPRCKTWGNLSLDQWEGRVSVLCTAPVRPGCSGYDPDKRFPCGYHETHEFAKELATTMQARVLTGFPVYEEDNVATP